jgi:uncharacterized protein (TIGR03083 family)
MAGRTFASWVGPIATMLAEGRRQVIAFARSAPPDLWDRPSAVDGWTHKDILAHLAGGNDQVLQQLLRSVAAGEPLDPALFQPDTDAENERGVAERRDWPVDRLIAELARGGDEVQELLSCVRETDEDLGQDELPVSLGGFLRIVEEERHDRLHLEQLQAGLGT